MTDSAQDRLSAVAGSLQDLTYSEMIEIASGLADIFLASDDFDTSSGKDWASLLHSWAENYGRFEP